MTKVFLSGSRSVNRLDETIRERVSAIVAQNFQILVGDANGADRAFQRFLADLNYQNVEVFCMEQKCRNNLANWQSRNIDNKSKLRGRRFYQIKDRAMAQEADYGLVIWDGKSVGSVSNVIELVKRNRPAVVYHSKLKRFFVLKKIEDLGNLLAHCEPDDFKRISVETELTNEATRSRQHQLDIV